MFCTELSSLQKQRIWTGVALVSGAALAFGLMVLLGNQGVLPKDLAFLPPSGSIPLTAAGAASTAGSIFAIWKLEAKTVTSVPKDKSEELEEDPILKPPAFSSPPVKKEPLIEPEKPKSLPQIRDTHKPCDAKKLKKLQEEKDRFISEANALIKCQFAGDDLSLELDPKEFAQVKAAAKRCGTLKPPEGMRAGQHFFMFELNAYPGVIFKLARNRADFFSYSSAAQMTLNLCNRYPDNLNFFKIPKFSILTFDNFQVLAEEKIQTIAVASANWRYGPGEPTQSLKMLYKWIYNEEKLQSYRSIMARQMATLTYYSGFCHFALSSFVLTQDAKIALVNLNDLRFGNYEQGWSAFQEVFSEFTSPNATYYYLEDTARHILNKSEKEIQAMTDKPAEKKRELDTRTQRKDLYKDAHVWMQKKFIEHPSQELDFKGLAYAKFDKPETKAMVEFIGKKINEELGPKEHWELISQRTIFFSPEKMVALAEELYPNETDSKEFLTKFEWGLSAMKEMGYLFDYTLHGDHLHATVIC